MSLLPGFRRPQTWRAIEIAAKVRCPACKQVLSVPDGCAVETAKCPKCGQVIRLKPPARQPEPSAAVSPPPPPTATPPPPPPTSRPARPSRPAAHRRPAARPKRSFPWPWLAALGAVAVLVVIALATGLFSGGARTTATGSRPTVHATQPNTDLKGEPGPQSAAPKAQTTLPPKSKADLPPATPSPEPSADPKREPTPQPATPTTPPTPGPPPKEHIQWTREKPSMIAISSGSQETLGNFLLLAWTDSDKDVFLAQMSKMRLLDGVRRAVCALMSTAERSKIDRVSGGFSPFGVMAVSESGATPEATATTGLKDPQDKGRIIGTLIYYTSKALLTEKPKQASVDLRRLGLPSRVVESLPRAKFLFAARVSSDGTSGPIWELNLQGK